MAILCVHDLRRSSDLTPLIPDRTGLGDASFAILLLILMSLPHALWSAARLH